MGDMHNLFGRLNEVHILSDENDPENFYIEEIVHGSSVEQVLKVMQYNPQAWRKMSNRSLINKFLNRK